jgi:hypothetical protein
LETASIKKHWWQPEILVRAGILFLCMSSAMMFNLPFYGDHVTLISIPAHFYYENGLQQLVLPSDIATGHPPFYAIVTALFWSLLGKSLWVSHLLTLCFGLMLLAQFMRLTKRILSDNQQSLALVLLIFNPVFLAQMANMSLDIMLCAVFLWGINAIFQQKKWELVIVAILLTISSLRGFMLVGALFLFDWQQNKFNLKYLIINILYYVISIIPVSIYFILVYRAQGWWLLPENGNWSAHRQWIGGDWLAKVGEFGIRNLEFGMLIPVIFVTVYCLRNFRTLKSDKPMLLVLLTGVVLALFLLPFKNPILIRYLLPLQLLILIVFSRQVLAIRSLIFRSISIVFTLLMMASQHFFVYPASNHSYLAYNWGDGSLAHLSYFTFRADLHDEIVRSKLPSDSIYAGFPDYKAFRFTDLSDDTVEYASSNDPFCYKYIIVGNMMNNIPLWQKQQIYQTCIIRKTYNKYPVEYTLYENPNYRTKVNQFFCK